MLLIHCPYCNAHRDEEEFTCQGEAFITRPADPQELTDKQWGEYLFFRSNERGLHAELWYHAAGCRRFFNVLRDTVTYEIHGSCRIGERFDNADETHA